MPDGLPSILRRATHLAIGAPVAAALRARAPRMGARALIALTGAMMIATTCTDPPGPRGSRPPGDGAASLEIIGPAELLLHATMLYSVVARDSAGNVVSTPASLVWGSSDTQVLDVQPSNVVRAAGRGSARLTVRSGSLQASVLITVKAAIKILPQFGRTVLPGEAEWVLGVGDTLPLRAFYADVNGIPVGDTAHAVWSSSDPATVGVSATGTVTALGQVDVVRLTATTTDGTDSTIISVPFTAADPPATVRFANAASNIGPVTFHSSKDSAVTLAYGQYADVSVTPGLLYVETLGLPALPYPADFDGHIQLVTVHPKVFTSFYAVGGTLGSGPQAAGGVVASSTDPATVPPDSARVRFVEGWLSAGVIFLRPTGAPASGLPELCYFDPFGVSDYFSVPPGDFDVIAETKYGATTAQRMGATAPAGAKRTIVIAGTDQSGWELVSFPDP
jgi:hypothetical protein